MQHSMLAPGRMSGPVGRVCARATMLWKDGMLLEVIFARSSMGLASGTRPMLAPRSKEKVWETELQLSWALEEETWKLPGAE